MTDIVFNIAKGRWGELCKLGAANDALIAVPLETTGLESDATLKDYADLGSLLAAANNEQTTMGRKTLASVTSAVDNTGDKWAADAADPAWVAAAGNAISKLVICYDPDTTGGTDSDLVPLFGYDCVLTPDGSDFTFVLNAAGLATAS